MCIDAVRLSLGKRTTPQFIDHDLTKITSGTEALDIPVPKVRRASPITRAPGIAGV
jgi:hypothetical protein